MQTLVDELGNGAYGLMMLAGALLAMAGLVVRAWGRRRLARVERARAGQRRAGEVADGPCTVFGRWRGLEAGRAIVEDVTGGAVLVTLEATVAAPALADGAEVLVVGVAMGRADDPRGVGYRGAAQLAHVRVDVDGLVSGTPDLLQRWARRARWAAFGGGVCFAGGVGIVSSAVLVLVRAIEI
jgi:hypothetical protein